MQDEGAFCGRYYSTLKQCKSARNGKINEKKKPKFPTEIKNLIQNEET